MYKLLLCWRYLRTRYFIAFASIISVMLGVATMIIVNSVMAGFSDKAAQIRGIICRNVVLESGAMEGMRIPPAAMELIRRVAGDDIQGMTPICVVTGLLTYKWHGIWVANQVQVIGIDEKTQGQVSDFAKYLQHPENRRTEFHAPGGLLLPPPAPGRGARRPNAPNCARPAGRTAAAWHGNWQSRSGS